MKPLSELVFGRMTIDFADREVADILRWTCLDCGLIAHSLRAAGYDIARKAEAEQSAVLLWMLSLYRDHGAEWRTRGAEKLNEMRAALDRDAASREAK